VKIRHPWGGRNGERETDTVNSLPSSDEGFTGTDLARVEADTAVKAIEFHHQIRSTNDRALEMAAGDDLETPLLVLAEHQTHGRGRGANPWWSAEGALTFSLLLDSSRWGNSSTPPPQVALAAGLSVCRAIDQLLPEHRPGLKWPNDVYLQGRKVCGILIESRHAKCPRTVLGVGINVNNSFASAPTNRQQVAVSMSEVAGRRMSRTRVLIGFLRHLEGQLDLLARDISPLIEACRHYCLLQGQTVECHVGSRRVRGVCRGIDQDGALRLDTESGVERCFSGQVELCGKAAT
jgi:BirA family biotin operon repressor/biotin-[acetyl-CoA-carboxylase] ligase